MDTHKKQQGQQAEQQACKFLLAKNLRLITQNYRCKYGEIDIIMRDQEDIVFVEVRSRERTDYGNVLESVNRHKQKKIITTATHFLQQRDWLYTKNCRFDVVGIHPTNIEWIKNAFMTGTS